MGFMRKALFLGTGGLSGAAGVRANSKKERTAKAAEKQVRLQKQAMGGGRARAASPSRATVAAFRIPCVHCKQHVRVPVGEDIACPKCGQSMDVVRRGGYGFHRIKAVVPVPHALDSRGRIISRD
jgi:hypothetical protein